MLDHVFLQGLEHGRQRRELLLLCPLRIFDCKNGSLLIGNSDWKLHRCILGSLIVVLVALDITEYHLGREIREDIILGKLALRVKDGLKVQPSVMVNHLVSNPKRNPFILRWPISLFDQLPCITYNKHKEVGLAVFDWGRYSLPTILFQGLGSEIVGLLEVVPVCCSFLIIQLKIYHVNLAELNCWLSHGKLGYLNPLRLLVVVPSELDDGISWLPSTDRVLVRFNLQQELQLGWSRIAVHWCKVS